MSPVRRRCRIKHYYMFAALIVRCFVKTHTHTQTRKRRTDRIGNVFLCNTGWIIILLNLARSFILVDLLYAK